MVGAVFVARSLAYSRVMRGIGCVTAFSMGSPLSMQSARVGLEELGSGHPFFHTKADADGIALFTETHEEAPVVLQAPTPSPALRASSLFGDLMRLANSLGARPVNAPAR
jgi:hypothetical protein